MVRWKIWLSILLFLVLVLLTDHPVIALDEPWTAVPWIAHGMGGMAGQDYTNSWEAFFSNYNRHFRLFEVDLTFTRDELLVANHDWSGYQQPPSHDEFMQMKVKGMFHPLDLHGIIWLMEKFPDIYVITDTKETAPEQIHKQFTYLVEEVKKNNPALLDRIIPEIYNPEMYQIVNGIHPFLHQIYSTYMLDAGPRDVIEFMKGHGLRVIALSMDHVTRNYVRELRAAGFYVFAHPVNSYQQMQTLQEWGVNGFYTDFLNPN